MRELGRRPGSLRTVRRTVPAPPDLGTEVIAVPEGEDLDLDLRLEAVMDGVLVTGRAEGPATGECARCLDPVHQRVDVTFQELYAYDPGDRARPRRDAPGDEDADEDLLHLEGDMLDLEPTVRDALVLALPFRPLCRDDCPGLCSTCGARLADDPEHHHDEVDPRWAALESVLRGGPDVPDDERES